MDSQAERDNNASNSLVVINNRMAMELIPTFIYLLVLLIVGLVGNSVVLLVYYRRFKPSTTRTFILAMSVFGLATNILSLPGEIVDVRFPYSLDNPGLCRFMRFNNSFFTLITAFILVPLALDRFRKICRPLNKQHSLRRTTVSIVMCAGVSVVLTIPFTVLNGRHTVDTGVGNITGVTCSTDDEFVNTLFPIIHSVMMGLAFIISVIIIVTSYACIAGELWRHKKSFTVSAPSAACADDGWRDSDGRPGSITREESSSNDDTSSDSRPADPEFQPPSGQEGGFVSGRSNSSMTANGNRTPATDVSCRDSKVPVLMSVTNTSSDTRSDQFAPSLRVTSGDTGAPDREDRAHNRVDSPLSSLFVPVECPDVPRKCGDLKHNENLHKCKLRSADYERLNVKSLNASFLSTRRRQGAGKKIPKSTTFMMFVLSTIFIINYLPHLIIISARAAVDDVSTDLTGLSLNAYHIALRSYFINSAVSSIVYGFCSARFRQECRLLLWPG